MITERDIEYVERLAPVAQLLELLGDKFVFDGEVETQADESYTSHNTERLDVAGTIAKIKTAEYVQLALEGREHEAVQ